MRRIPTHKKWFAAALVCAVLLGAECIAAWAGGLLLLPGVHGFVTPGLGLLLTVLLGITLWKYRRAKQRISRPCIWLGGAAAVGCAVTEAFEEYARPLILDEVTPVYVNGTPRHIRL